MFHREPEGSSNLGVRGAEISPPSPRPLKSRRGTTESQGAVGNNTHSGPPVGKNAPSISIEPNTSLELTDDIFHGQTKVMTRDTPLAKAYGSDKHETEVFSALRVHILPPH